ELVMYKATVRALVRHGLKKLNAGDPSFLLAMAHPEADLAFPGDNSFAAMYRPVVKGPDAHITHRGADELQGFAHRFVRERLEFVVEDILVNGLPHRTRVAVRGRMRIPGPGLGAPDEYQNRIVAYITLGWGRMVAWEDYEDTERVSAWDAAATSADRRSRRADQAGLATAVRALAMASSKQE
ncbi:MAG: nuclear transport factor 2 family protein, partial [Acidimicrobiales bacterium]